MGKYNKNLLKKLDTPGILVFEEKHSNRYFSCKTREDFCKAAFSILKERFQDGWYYDEDENLEAGTILDKKLYEEAFLFIHNRKYGEYEDFKIVYPEEPVCGC